MRVLMLTAHPGIQGPLPKLAPLMVDGLRRLGCEVTTEPWSAHRERESALERVAGRAQDLWRVLKHLQRRPCDVMLVTTTLTWMALLRDVPLVAATRWGCRARVLHWHGSKIYKLHGRGGGLMRACTGWMLRRCDALLVLSTEEREELQRLYPGVRIEVVMNPFVPPAGGDGAGPRPDREAPVLLFMGRLIPEKGVFDLLEALRLLPPERRFILRIAGSGGHEDALRRRIADLGLQGSAEMVGYVEGEALADLYRSADVFVLPTYFSEGFPTVIPEAMSYGLPIVTTPVRGSKDLLVDGENVVFVPPRQPRALAEALKDLLDDPGTRTAMGERNRKKVEEWAPDRVIPRYVEIMASLLPGAARDRDQAP